MPTRTSAAVVRPRPSGPSGPGGPTNTARRRLHRRPTVALTGLLALEALAVVVLHRLGEVRWLALPGDDWTAWLATSAPEDVLATALRVVALACGWWLLATTVLYVGARASRVTGAIRAVEWVTLPVVRRVADRAVAVTITASAVLGSGGAALAQELAPPPPITEHAEGNLPFAGVPAPLVAPAEVRGLADVSRVAGTTSRLGVGAPALQASPQAPLPPGAAGPAVLGAGAWTIPGSNPLPDGATEAAEPAVDSAAHHQVIAGEHLWGIAAAVLGQHRDVDPSTFADRDIHAYWVQLVEVNRTHLRSGMPDVVHPGEMLQLPPVA